VEMRRRLDEHYYSGIWFGLRREVIKLGKRGFSSLSFYSQVFPILSSPLLPFTHAISDGLLNEIATSEWSHPLERSSVIPDPPLSAPISNRDFKH